MINPIKVIIISLLTNILLENPTTFTNKVMENSITDMLKSLNINISVSKDGVDASGEFMINIQLKPVSNLN